jgi:molecular chaperone GrpE
VNPETSRDNEHDPEPETPAEAAPAEAEAGEGKINVTDRRFWARDGAEEAGEAEEAKPSYVQELERKVAEKDARLQATLAQYKEALDDFEAAKARIRRDVAKEVEAGKKKFLGELLDVVDNLERALQAAGTGQGDPAGLLSGVTLVRDQFLAKLQSMGVRKLEAQGAVFDPTRFEAVSIVPVPDPAQDGKVVGVVRDCYLIGDETLRYGMVAVGKGPSQNDKRPEPAKA